MGKTDDDDVVRVVVSLAIFSSSHFSLQVQRGRIYKGERLITSTCMRDN